MSKSYCDIHYVYVLLDPRSDNTIRYVGRSCNPEDRYKSHLLSAKKKSTYKQNWINSLLVENIKPLLKVIFSSDPKTVKVEETRLIRKESKVNSKLTNSSTSFHKKSLVREKRDVVGVHLLKQRWAAYITLDYQIHYLGSFKSKNAARRHYDSVARYYLGNQAKTNFEGISSFSIEKAKEISNKVLRILNYKSPYKGITWDSKWETYKIFDPNQKPSTYITSEKDLEKARQIQLDYLNGKTIEQIQSEKVIAHRNKYRGVSFSERDQAYLVTLKLPGENKYKLLAQFSDEEKAKEWHDVVASYYNLPINEEPLKSFSFEEAKKQIRLDRGQHSKYKGVGSYRDKFIAKISLKGKSIHLGIYNTEEEAVYIADAVRNYYNLPNNNTTEDKLSIEQVVPKKEKCKYKNIRLDNKTSKYVVHFQQVRPKVYVGEYPTEEKALLARDRVAKHLGLPTEVHHNCSPMTLEDAKIEKGTKLHKR